MAESTIRKTKVSFHIKATGTFVVTCDSDDSPAKLLEELVKTGQLSYSDLYLHAEEFEWEFEVGERSVAFEMGRLLERERGEGWQEGYEAARATYRSLTTSDHEQLEQGTKVHSCSPDDPSGPTDEESYPSELGGGKMPRKSPTLVCECGRTFVEPCVCGRTSEQFEQPVDRTRLVVEAAQAVVDGCDLLQSDYSQIEWAALSQLRAAVEALSERSE